MAGFGKHRTRLIARHTDRIMRHRHTCIAEVNWLSRKNFATALFSLLVSIGAVPLWARAPLSTTITLDRVAASRAGVSTDVLNLALNAVTCGVASGDLATPPTLTLIDYSLPSTQPRLWVFDL